MFAPTPSSPEPPSSTCAPTSPHGVAILAPSTPPFRPEHPQVHAQSDAFGWPPLEHSGLGLEDEGVLLHEEILGNLAGGEEEEEGLDEVRVMRGALC